MKFALSPLLRNQFLSAGKPIEGNSRPSVSPSIPYCWQTHWVSTKTVGKESDPYCWQPIRRFDQKSSPSRFTFCWNLFWSRGYPVVIATFSSFEESCPYAQQSHPLGHTSKYCLKFGWIVKCNCSCKPRLELWKDETFKKIIVCNKLNLINLLFNS